MCQTGFEAVKLSAQKISQLITKFNSQNFFMSKVLQVPWNYFHIWKILQAPSHLTLFWLKNFDMSKVLHAKNNLKKICQKFFRFK